MHDGKTACERELWEEFVNPPSYSLELWSQASCPGVEVDPEIP